MGVFLLIGSQSFVWYIQLPLKLVLKGLYKSARQPTSSIKKYSRQGNISLKTKNLSKLLYPPYIIHKIFFIPIVRNKRGKYKSLTQAMRKD
jgi:hypothetical protein